MPYPQVEPIKSRSSIRLGTVSSGLRFLQPDNVQYKVNHPGCPDHLHGPELFRWGAGTGRVRVWVWQAAVPLLRIQILRMWLQPLSMSFLFRVWLQGLIQDSRTPSELCLHKTFVFQIICFSFSLKYWYILQTFIFSHFVRSIVKGAVQWADNHFHCIDHFFIHIRSLVGKVIPLFFPPRFLDFPSSEFRNGKTKGKVIISGPHLPAFSLGYISFALFYVNCFLCPFSWSPAVFNFIWRIPKPGLSSNWKSKEFIYPC